MKKKSKWKLRLLVSISLILAVYLLPCLYLSIRVYAAVISSYDNYGQNNPFPNFLSAEQYERIGFRQRYEGDVHRKRSVIWFPFTYIKPNGEAKSIYRFSYDAYDKDMKPLGGASGVPVYLTMQLTEGKWRVIDLYEPP